jgi:hypothetical protein
VQIAESTKLLQHLQQRMDGLTERLHQLHSQEELLGVTITVLPVIGGIQAFLEPYTLLLQCSEVRPRPHAHLHKPP